MGILTVVFGILSGCLLSVLVGIIGSSRRIGFGWAFLISLIFTPLVGLIVALLTDPLPGGDRRWGCIGTLLAILAWPSSRRSSCCCSRAARSCLGHAEFVVF